MSSTPNEGTRNKRELMHIAEEEFKSWGRINEEKAVGKLGYILNITTRTARESYYFQLKAMDKIIKYQNGDIEYTDNPSAINEKYNKEELERLTQEALKEHRKEKSETEELKKSVDRLPKIAHEK
jgi:hypothetical protein